MDNKESIQTEILEFLPDAVIIHCMGRIIFVNKAAVVLAGADDARDLVGKPIDGFIPSKNSDEIKRKTRKMLRQRILHSKWELVKLNGETVQCEVSATVIKYR